MLNFHIKLYCKLILLTLLFNSCNDKYKSIDSRTIDDIVVYEKLLETLSGLEKNGKKRIFHHPRDINHLKVLCDHCGIVEEIIQLYQRELLFGYDFESPQEVYFFVKNYSAWYLEDYTHTLIYSPNKIPSYYNTEGDTSIEMVKLEKIKENWYYRIMVYND